jgi:AbrB family looped-hinge helix DNA binding protein
VKASVDSVGRVVIPKALRERLGIAAGDEVDISAYGDGLHIAPAGRTARLAEHNGRLVAVADTPVTDDDVFGLIDSLRK